MRGLRAFGAAQVRGRKIEFTPGQGAGEISGGGYTYGENEKLRWFVNRGNESFGFLPLAFSTATAEVQRPLAGGHRRAIQ